MKVKLFGSKIFFIYKFCLSIQKLETIFYMMSRIKNGIIPLIIFRHEDEVGSRSGTSIKISKMTPFDQPNPV